MLHRKPFNDVTYLLENQYGNTVISETLPRSAGVLLHITSLPNPEGPGKFNAAAYDFLDWLSTTGFHVWQILPMGPTHEDGSPYLALSAFAGAPAFIDIAELRHDKALNESWFGKVLDETETDSLDALETTLHHYADASFSELPNAREFLKSNEYWLQDYAQFMTIRHAQQHKPWWEWPEALRGRDPVAVREVISQYRQQQQLIVIEQYLFDRQWQALKQYANQRGVKLFGDLPLYVSHDSADTWANRRFFALDEAGQATTIAGAPPDMFTDHGQRWGNPVYNWSALEHDGFRWWVDRIKRQLDLFDLIRIDHFRGLEAYWAIPADAEFASAGDWVKAPGDELLETLRSELGDLPLVAEDLGYITKEVDELREKYHLPCMRVLQFAFDGKDDNPHLAYNYCENTVAYTGTHDNDTVIGWFESLHPEAQAYIRYKLGISEEDSILDTMVKTVMDSVAFLAILPMQDILGLGHESRMNMPGTMENNWSWQYSEEQLTDAITEKYRGLLKAASRI
ncbi:MAG TPA: 4-alpha-glucanotransferase [Gammaproteobacteria bacterium]|nr:4-alpha-glucanotransferase [Gammaproteobacteria bacterium]